MSVKDASAVIKTRLLVVDSNGPVPLTVRARCAHGAPAARAARSRSARAAAFALRVQ